MSRATWRSELAAFRRARVTWCDVCAAAVSHGLAAEVFTYAIGRSARGVGLAAQLNTERRVRLPFCTRHLRALRRGHVLLAGSQAVSLVAQSRRHAAAEGRHSVPA